MEVEYFNHMTRESIDLSLKDLESSVLASRRTGQMSRVSHYLSPGLSANGIWTENINLF